MAKKTTKNVNKKLVIVESPAKAKTIKKYLGKNFEVVASMGHIRDLPKSTLGVDLENNFEPHYINIRRQSQHIKNLKANAKNCSKIYLATDPDREGEAISWHLANLLGVDINEENRITFNEITKSGVKGGMENPRKIDMDLVDAQQARRILDRIVGYKISPYLWKRIKSGLSAGRVQSVAVKLIVDRENEIKNFDPKEYWSIEGKLLSSSSKTPFLVKYFGESGKKVELTNKEMADAVLEKVKDSDFIVEDIKQNTKQKSPLPPFITSTLQQEASQRLNFQAKKTMNTAQELYEGVDVEKIGAVGLITYMRTDSLRISEEALTVAREYIKNNFGDEYLPNEPRVYKSKKNTQDAHEAIRPSLPELSPNDLKASLTNDQFKLYKLIWERFMASQMTSAVFDTINVTINASDSTFKASGSKKVFNGYTALYQTKVEDEQKDISLPNLVVMEKLKVNNMLASQHFTSPPPRFNEASLIKTMEENGIGRPSTYAPTITTILARYYVEREAKQLKPTVLGEITTQLLQDYFDSIVDVNFTASMENSLDVIEDGKVDWQNVVREFYIPFKEKLDKAEETIGSDKIKLPVEESDIICENCGKNMVVKLGKYGKFLACPGFPDCKNIKRIAKEASGACPKCGNKIHELKSKKGRKYFACENNPTCDFMSWDTPTIESCPICHKTLLQKNGKNPKIYCSNDECTFEKESKK